MASKNSGRAGGANWSQAWRASARRAMAIGGAALLFLLMVFLGLAIASYAQTDASASTAASQQGFANWMGASGAWAAERLLFLFGPSAILLLPLLYVSGQKLWRRNGAAGPIEDEGKWWLPVVILGCAIAAFATVFSLIQDGPGGSLPAGLGGITGLLGAAAVKAIAIRFGETWAGWIILGMTIALACLGVAIVTRVFAIEWRRWLRLPSLGRHQLKAIAGQASSQLQGKASLARVPSHADGAGDGAGDGTRGTNREFALSVAEAPRRAPEITEGSTVAAAAVSLKEAPAKQRDMFATYELPSVDLLADAPENTAPKLDKLALERNARLLETVLDDFNVKGEITAVRTGPVVTMYELEPAPGIKASRVIGLAEDIARNMSAVSARVSSIPGKTVMGIELPNAHRQMVALKELAVSDEFQAAKGALPIILGKDIAGLPIVADLAAMPHLLVAGTTGSGKSVGLNCILLSLLYRFTPEECRLILIDPKVLELKTYDDIPHLLSPVVTEPQKSVRALKWAVEEMERRYRMMSSVSSRNIAGFNEKVRVAAAKGKPLGRRVQTGFDPDTGEELYEEEQLDYDVLPQIVLIVDELADLMVTVGKEIEVLIQRLSQKSRAAGIHLIMATQRPSVDVITGVIKANLPTRISFKVTSRIDSRTILGEQGSEQLLGKGDMLYKPSSGATVRVHGPFVSDEEVEAIADHWRAQGKPVYIDAVTEEPEEGSVFGFDDDVTASDNPEERKYRQACHIVIENQKASGSWLQRQMGVGYNTAAKWIERMEAEGLVGPANHVGRREIYRDAEGNPL